MSLKLIAADCGLFVKKFEPVHGGDINKAYLLESDNEKYFLKVNDAGRYPGMFEKEARGLGALKQGPLLVPTIIKTGVAGNDQYLLLEWIETGRPAANFWDTFGSGLAALHKQTQTQFGWEEDNYIGSLVQSNSWKSEWHSFFADCRVLPLVRTLVNSGAFSTGDAIAAESFCKRIVTLFPAEPPALLHGDLWGGNFMVGANGSPVLIDPAVYYGHREIDLGMTKLFGGFDDRFYSAYQEAYPLQSGWKDRVTFSQLYPLLVHAVLFGGSYVQSARGILTNFT